MNDFMSEESYDEKIDLRSAKSGMLITSAQAKNVRFTNERNGYSYEQVESFVGQVVETLEFVESKMLDDHDVLKDAKSEIKSLEETIVNLKTTIEVFRARGDVLTNSDGSFATVSSQQNEVAQLKSQIQQLRAELATSKEDANAGWAAEAELREYIEKQLKPWLDSKA